MTFGKAGLVTAGFVAAFAVGVMTGPTIRDNWDRTKAPEETVVAQPETSAPAPVKAGPAPRAKASAETVASKNASDGIWSMPVNFWEPKMRDRAKAVLNRGADLEIASADFRSTEQFMTVAHAARNTQVPFMVLKDRVLNQDQSLAEAIHEFKPELDEKAEVTRAREAARSDLEIAG